MENFDFAPEFADELLKDYFYNRRVFFILIIIQFFVQLYIVTLTWSDRDLVFSHFQEIYKYHVEQVKHFFYLSLVFDICVNIIAMVLAVRAYATHQINAYKTFSVVYAISIVSRIILAYLNTWNVIMFIIMLFTYTYSRYMIALIYGICLVPNQQPPQRLV